MASNRIYVNATVYGARITGLRHLWEPSTEFQGKKVEKPNYLTGVIVPKTQAAWYYEPILAGLVASCQELYGKVLGPMGIPFDAVSWPVKDGDVSPMPGKPPIEWCKGHWFISGSSTQPISVDIVQNGAAVRLQNRAGVKAGDYVVLSGVVVQKTNDPRGVKLYANNVLFVAPGEEIAVGNSVSGSELMEQAKAKGMAITGFGPSHAGGFGGGQPFQQPQQGGFGGAPSQGGGGFPGQSQPGNPAPSFQAPPPMQPPTAGFGATPQMQPPYPTAQPGYAPQWTAPNPQPQQGGFQTPPNGFAPPR